MIIIPPTVAMALSLALEYINTANSEKLLEKVYQGCQMERDRSNFELLLFIGLLEKEEILSCVPFEILLKNLQFADAEKPLPRVFECLKKIPAFQEDMDLLEQPQGRDNSAVMQSIELTPVVKRNQTKAVIEAIDLYILNRDKHLSFFSKCFDYKRGLDRAKAFKDLIKSTATEAELNVIIYALLAANDGIWLKKYVYQSLGFQNLKEAQENFKNRLLKHNDNKEALNSEVARIVETTNEGVAKEALRLIP